MDDVSMGTRVEDVEDDWTSKDGFLRRLSMDDPHDIQLRTVGQKDSALWREMRHVRLTASNFGKICKLRPTTDRVKTVRGLLYSDFKGNEAVRWGCDHEDVALRCFEDVTGFTVKKCGLFIDESKPFVAASPDGVLESQDALVEVKCPFTAKDMMVEEAVRKGLLKFLGFDNGKLMLRDNHNYYYQIQGQLNITGRSECYFIVWTTKDLWFQVIKKDESFWKGCMEKLEVFYMEHMLPELLKVKSETYKLF